jgi:hypothetical protein
VTEGQRQRPLYLNLAPPKADGMLPPWNAGRRSKLPERHVSETNSVPEAALT